MEIEEKLASLNAYRGSLDESGREIFDMLMGCAREVAARVEQQQLALSI